MSVPPSEQLSAADRRGGRGSCEERQHLQDPVQLRSHLPAPRCQPRADRRGHPHSTAASQARRSRPPLPLAPSPKRLKTLATASSTSPKGSPQARILRPWSALLHNRALRARQPTSPTGCPPSRTPAAQTASPPFHIPKHTAAKPLGPVWSLEAPAPRRQGDPTSAKTPQLGGRTQVTVQRLSFIIVGPSSAQQENQVYLIRVPF